MKQKVSQEYISKLIKIYEQNSPFQNGDMVYWSASDGSESLESRIGVVAIHRNDWVELEPNIMRVMIGINEDGSSDYVFTHQDNLRLVSDENVGWF